MLADAPDAGIFPERLETTHPVPTAFRVPRLRGWLVLEVRVAWAAPAEVSVSLEPKGSGLEESVTPHQRGRTAVSAATSRDAAGPTVTVLSTGEMSRT